MKNLSEQKVLLEPFLQKYRFSEHASVLRIYDCHLDGDSFQDLLRAFDTKDSFGCKIFISDEVDETVDGRGSHFEDGASFLIRVDKPTGTKLVFFTEKGFEDYLLDDECLNEVEVVFLSFAAKSFSTLSCLFIPFEAKWEKQSFENKIQVLDHVKPLTASSQQFLAKDLSKWILQNDETQSAPSCWMGAAATKLLVCLGREFTADDTEIQVNIVGERRKKIVAHRDLRLSPEELSMLSKVVSWIYLNTTDVDSRHTIFNYELSKVIEDTLEVGIHETALKIVSLAFESSELVYRYHLVNSSKELNKVLTDLNKSLFEYISKIRQHTVDLINALWRDFATAFGVIILNYTIKKTDIQSGYFEFFGAALCFYLAISFGLSAKSNRWFYKSLVTSLRDWRPRIYGYITDADFEKSTLSPLKKAYSMYKFTFWFVLCLYVVSIIAVAHFLLKLDFGPVFNFLKSIGPSSSK